MWFNAFSPLNGGTLDTYLYKSESPFNFDAGLDYTRPAGPMAPMPYPLVTGYQPAVAPLLDQLQLAIMKGQLPMGPEINMLDNPAAPLFAFPNIGGGLTKVAG